MRIRIIHESGKVYTMPVNEAIVYAENGEPVAIVYERDGLIAYSDVSHKDFDKVASTLKVRRIEPDG